MRKVLLSCIGILLFGIGFSGAQNSLTQPPPDNFVVEVSPSSFQTNQPVDVRITAYRNGNVYKDYVGAVWLEIAELSPNEYVISASSNSIGWYFFSPQDLGQKLFSKGLEIKRVGQFTLRVSDYSDAAVGTTKVTVTSSQPSPSVSKIEILAPSPNSVVSQSAIAMVAYAPELKGATAQIFLNSNLLPGDHRFDASDGTLSPALSNLKEGVNTLLIRVMNISDVEIGSSDEVSFTYAPLTDNLLKRITATPSTGLRGGDTVTFELTTDDSIGSAVLLITDIQGFTQRLPMDKSADGLFTRNPAMLVTGALSIGAELTSMGLTRTYSGVLTLFVDDAPLISNVMFQLDTQTLRDLTMSWKVSRAEVTNFRVKYGLSPTELTGVEVDKPSILFTSIDPTKEYYFQIIPLLGGEKTHGTATEVYVYSPLLNTGTRLPPTPTTGTNPPIPIGPDIAKSTCVIK